MEAAEDRSSVQQTLGSIWKMWITGRHQTHLPNVHNKVGAGSFLCLQTGLSLVFTDTIQYCPCVLLSPTSNPSAIQHSIHLSHYPHVIRIDRIICVKLTSDWHFICIWFCLPFSFHLYSLVSCYFLRSSASSLRHSDIHDLDSSVLSVSYVFPCVLVLVCTTPSTSPTLSCNPLDKSYLRPLFLICCVVTSLRISLAASFQSPQWQLSQCEERQRHYQLCMWSCELQVLH